MKFIETCGYFWEGFSTIQKPFAKIILEAFLESLGHLQRSVIFGKFLTGTGNFWWYLEASGN